VGGGRIMIRSATRRWDVRIQTQTRKAETRICTGSTGSLRKKLKSLIQTRSCETVTFTTKCCATPLRQTVSHLYGHTVRLAILESNSHCPRSYALGRHRQRCPVA
jgi:hypothetical protein